jgi:phosphoglycerate dehydrogenase-like enzyme
VWRALRGTELYGKTLGIVGLGAIGSHVARLGRGLGMRTAAAVRTPKPELAKELGCDILPLDELLARADHLCLCLPGGGGVLLGEREFGLMKPGAGLINIARGSLVDEKAMIRALQDGRLGGAALDVYAVEPLPRDSPLLAMPNVVTTPHMASNTCEARDAVFLACLEEVAKRAAGRRSEQALNPAAYAVKR